MRNLGKITSLMVVLCLGIALISMLFRSDDPLRKNKRASLKVSSPRAEKLLHSFKNVLDEQELAREEEEEIKAKAEEERLVQNTIDLTIAELLALDPKKDADRIKELCTDLYNIGSKALDALKTMLSEDHPSQQKVLLMAAIGYFSKSELASEQLFAQAVNSGDAEVRKEALVNLKNSANKGQLIDKTISKYREASKKGKPDVQGEVAAIETLGALGGDIAAGEAYKILKELTEPALKKKAIEAIGNAGGDYAKSILSGIYEQGDDMNADAAVALGKLKDEGVAAMFGETLLNKEASPSAKAAAIKGLSADNGALSRRILSNALLDTTQGRDVHQGAIEALLNGYEKLPSGELDTYVNLFAKTTTDYLPQMLQPLLAKGGEDAIQKLAQVYPELNQEKKIHEIRTLGRIHSRDTFEALKTVLDSEKDVGLQKEIITAMKSSNTGLLTSEIVNVFSGIAESQKDKQLRIEALKNIGEISPDNAVNVAAKIIYGEKDADLRRAGIDILGRYAGQRDGDILRSFLLSADSKGMEDVINQALAAIEARKK